MCRFKILAQLFLEKQKVIEELFFFSCLNLCNDDNRDYKLIYVSVTFNDLFVHEGFQPWHIKFVTIVIGIISQFRSLSVFVNKHHNRYRMFTQNLWKYLWYICVKYFMCLATLLD